MTSKVIFIYKICPEQDWRSAVEKGIFTGTQIDIEDGFIHFSPPEEVETTAAKYFVDKNHFRSHEPVSPF